MRGHRGHGRMVVGFTTTEVITSDRMFCDRQHDFINRYGITVTD
jgi:hypothetical protein